MNDKLRQAAEMALEALEDVQDMMTTSDWFNDRVQALRQALDQLPDNTKMIEPSMGLIPSEWAGLEKSDIPIDRGAWSDVPDATKWVDELRGEDDELPPVKTYCGGKPNYCEPKEPPNSTTDVVEPMGEIVEAHGLVGVSIPEMPPVGTKLYTAPPKREWVGLTDDEITEAGKSTVEGKYMLPHSFARAIESVLKTKNGF